MKKMKTPEIWFVTLNDIFQPTGFGSTRRNRIQALSKYTDIHLFAPFPPPDNSTEKTCFSSVNFHGVAGTIDAGLSILWLFRYYKLILQIFDTIPKQSIIYTDSFLIPLSQLILRKKYHFVLDYHGIYFRELIERGYAKKTMLLHFVKAVERRSLKMCSKIICIDRKIIEYIQKEVGIDPPVLAHISNGVNLQHFDKNIKTKSLRNELDISNDDIVLFFSGGFQPWHGLDNLIDVLIKLCLYKLQFKMVFVGDGPELKRIEQRCKNELPEGVAIFTGKINYNDLPYYTSIADICLYFPKLITDNLRGYYGDPAKFYEWMAMKKPIITIDAPDLIYRFGDDPPTALAKPNVTSFTQAVKDMIVNKKEKLEVGEKGYQFVKNNNTWDIIGKKICDFIFR